MTYTTDIPISGDTLGGTRDRIRTNFQLIESINSINHVAYGSLGQGKHKFLQMPEVTASGAGVPTTLANEGGLYVDVGVNPSESNLFFRGESNGFQYQLTKAIQASTAKFGTFTAAGAVTPNYAQTGGWTFLAGSPTLGGLIYQYASVISTLGTPQISPSTISVTFPIPFASTNIIVTITPICKAGGTSQSHTASLINGSLTNTGFACNFDTSTTAYVGFTWTAIGI